MSTVPPSSAPADWSAVRALFDALCARSPAEQRAALADPALPPAVRAEVAELLAHGAASSTTFLGHSAAQAAAGSVAAPAPASLTGQRLGAWRVTRLLGSGGMGEVYEARRDDGRFQGVAAIKLLKRGMDSQGVLARFALEQQALARLTHPHIARLLDAGVSPEGLPFFVMEHVQGRPIDQACAGLALPARLELFLQLADAVAHAHRNLLVHRDLKPGNVLVDTEGRVKLLDFGIAKALDPLEGNPDSTRTALAERPFTPHYASPEQVRGEPVTTATDIYSLGVLLYQLLTGARPTGRQSTTAAEAMRSVLDEMPARPSSVVQPGAEGERLQRQLRGDLDNVLLKALAKNPSDRYASVDALVADLRAHLDGRPVSARAASPGYLFVKWLGRHRAAAGAAALGGLGLITGLVATLAQGRVALALGALGLVAGLVLALLQARRAQLALAAAARARDEATRHLVELRRLANSMVFEVNDALEQGLVQGRRQLVHAAAQSLERQSAFGQLSDEERLELGRAIARLGRLEGQEFTSNLGNVGGALAHYERALQVLEPLAPRLQGSLDWHAAMVGALEGRATVLRTLRHTEEALATQRRVAEHAARAATLAPQDVRWRLQECDALAMVADQEYPIVRIHGLTRLDDAARHAEQAAGRAAALVPLAPEDPRTWQVRALTQRLVSGHRGIAGRLHEAVALEREAFGHLERAFALPGGEAVRKASFPSACLRLALTLRAHGDYDEAAVVMARLVEHTETRLRADPGDEFLQRIFAAAVQTAVDLCLHRDDPAAGVALHARATQALPPLPAAGGNRHWQHAWLDSLVVLCRLRSGAADAVDAARPVVQRLLRWLDDGTLKLREHTGALDCELEANLRIAQAHLAACQGDDAAATTAADAALERLAAMRALRDPRDAIEALRAWQLGVRLVQLPRLPHGTGAAVWVGLQLPALRAAQAELAQRGLVDTATRREALWLGATAPG